VGTKCPISDFLKEEKRLVLLFQFRSEQKFLYCASAIISTHHARNGKNENVSFKSCYLQFQTEFTSCARYFPSRTMGKISSNEGKKSRLIIAK